MKYFIIGLHSMGKQEVLNILESYDIKCGKIFSNIDKPSTSVYNSYNYEIYTNQDINDIFENNAYIFIQGLQSSANINSYKFFEGLSKYSFDQNDVFVLSPDQLLNIVPNSIDDEICFIWMDGNNINRKNRYRLEKRNYDFNERDRIEKQEIHSFVKFLYNFPKSKVLYFNNENPNRVAAVIYSLIKHPDLMDIYEKNFN